MAKSEQRSENPRVGGSIPPSATKYQDALSRGVFMPQASGDSAPGYFNLTEIVDPPELVFSVRTSRYGCFLTSSISFLKP